MPGQYHSLSRLDRPAAKDAEDEEGDGSSRSWSDTILHSSVRFILVGLVIISLAVGFSIGLSIAHIVRPRATLFEANHSLVDPVETAQLPIRYNTTAICVTGSLRGWPEPALAQSFKNNLMAAWNSDSRVFPVISEPDRDWQGTDIALDIDLTLVASPKQMQPHANNCTYPVSLLPNPTFQTLSFWVQQRKNQLCYNYVSNIEHGQGWRFEFFIRARSDGFYSTPIPLTYGTAPRDAISVFDYSKRYTAVSDHFAIVPRHLASVYFNTANAYDTCIVPGTQAEVDIWCNWATDRLPAQGQDYPAECILGHWLQTHNVSIFPFEYAIFKLWRGPTSQKHFSFMHESLGVEVYEDGRPLTH